MATVRATNDCEWKDEADRLRDELARVQAEQAAKLGELASQLEALKRTVFGKRSEKMPPSAATLLREKPLAREEAQELRRAARETREQLPTDHRGFHGPHQMGAAADAIQRRANPCTRRHALAHAFLPGAMGDLVRQAPDPYGCLGPHWAKERSERIMAPQAQTPAAYLDWGPPAVKGYYPVWVDKMAADATLEGSLLRGVVQGGEAVREIVVAIRALYSRQEHKFAGPYGDNGFMEEYIAEAQGHPIGCVVLIRRDPGGKTQRVIAGYRPLSSVIVLSRLLREKFEGTPLADQFAAGPPEEELSASAAILGCRSTAREDTASH